MIFFFLNFCNILEHLKIGFREQAITKYLQTLTLVFHNDPKKTKKNYICDEKFASLCTQ